VKDQKTILLLSLAIGVLLAGCGTPNIYYWGRYEGLIYGQYAHPDKASPELQSRLMEEDMHKAISANKPLPPGFHAHLGYLYYQMGKADRAVAEFQVEKTQFPESTVFMDRMISNLTKK